MNSTSERPEYKCTPVNSHTRKPKQVNKKSTCKLKLGRAINLPCGAPCMFTINISGFA